MNKVSTEIEASFLMTGFSCLPEEITKVIGVRPSDTWVKGDRIGKSILIRKSSGWRLRSKLSLHAELERHARYLLKRIYPKRAKLSSFKGYQAKFSVAMCILGSDRPPMVLPVDVVQQLAQLKAGVDIDLYNFEPDSI